MILLIKSEIRKREKIEGLYRAKLTQLGLPRDDQDFLQLYY